MDILKNKYFKVDFFLVIVLVFLGYKIFFSNRIKMLNSVKLTSQEIERYTYLAKRDNNQTAIQSLLLHYLIYENDKNMSCYWFSRKKDQTSPPLYCDVKADNFSNRNEKIP